MKKGSITDSAFPGESGTLMAYRDEWDPRRMLAKENHRRGNQELHKDPVKNWYLIGYKPDTGNGQYEAQFSQVDGWPQMIFIGHLEVEENGFSTRPCLPNHIFTFSGDGIYKGISPEVYAHCLKRLREYQSYLLRGNISHVKET